MITKNRPLYGSYSFHLSHDSRAPQFLTIRDTLFPRAESTLSFKSFVGRGSATQIAKVQVSSDQGYSWDDIFSQSATNPDDSFQNRFVSLRAFSRQPIQLRFNYDIATTADGWSTTGWYIDDIEIKDTDKLLFNETYEAESSTNFIFRPLSPGTYALQVRPYLKEQPSVEFEWGPHKVVAF